MRRSNVSFCSMVGISGGKLVQGQDSKAVGESNPAVYEGWPQLPQLSVAELWRSGRKS